MHYLLPKDTLLRTYFSSRQKSQLFCLFDLFFTPQSTLIQSRWDQSIVLIFPIDDILDKLGSLHASWTNFEFDNGRLLGEGLVSKINFMIFLVFVMWLLVFCVSSSECCGLVYRTFSKWLKHFLVKLIYILAGLPI